MTERQAGTSALFVRIPQAQARALDRLAFESGRPKQAVVSDLLARYIGGPPPSDEPRARRAAAPERGWHSFTPNESPAPPGEHRHETDVLTLEGVAALLGVEPDQVAALAERGELPGRRIGGGWRFARAAVLAWLASGEPVPASGDR